MITYVTKHLLQKEIICSGVDDWSTQLNWFSWLTFIPTKSFCSSIVRSHWLQVTASGKLSAAKTDKFSKMKRCTKSLFCQGGEGRLKHFQYSFVLVAGGLLYLQLVCSGQQLKTSFPNQIRCCLSKSVRTLWRGCVHWDLAVGAWHNGSSIESGQNYEEEKI